MTKKTHKVALTYLSLFLSVILTFSLLPNLTHAQSKTATSNNSLTENEMSVLGGPNDGGPLKDLTNSFSKTMISNAVYMAYFSSMNNGFDTGSVFASKVKSNGPWDYKHKFGSKATYKFRGQPKTGEQLGNTHYGYVGRAAGFNATILISVAGAYQIYSGTSYVGWYKSYFDDPSDQGQIKYGIMLWNTYKLGIKSTSSSSVLTSTDDVQSIQTSQQYRDFLLANYSNLLTAKDKQEIANYVKHFEAKNQKN
ncbi:polymorphic toxin type 44 domain-containing protein [Sporolactobacillus shoreicorticis]|uniref:Polymorphic toxin type 44 domain-containing protein n=1 Tax=Sporolactobacillus shoreicorticis TaxID=1923877 RepID=A0ABW5S647_9BACL|nr:polymorphic toxin type 44 domain-containing protein [Sporolactobacillus shoreicorticis]MCO7128179.1 polymorphic toxin type 44 domain-containing protein [Sporolactobacillus shoreicorticis]